MEFYNIYIYNNENIQTNKKKYMKREEISKNDVQTIDETQMLGKIYRWNSRHLLWHQKGLQVHLREHNNFLSHCITPCPKLS